jgi:hypothetical protein
MFAIEAISFFRGVRRADPSPASRNIRGLSGMGDVSPAARD